MVRTAALIKNGCSLECLVAGFQDKTVYIGGSVTICELMGECKNGYKLF